MNLTKIRLLSLKSILNLCFYSLYLLYQWINCIAKCSYTITYGNIMIYYLEQSYMRSPLGLDFGSVDTSRLKMIILLSLFVAQGDRYKSFSEN